MATEDCMLQQNQMALSASIHPQNPSMISKNPLVAQIFKNKDTIFCPNPMMNDVPKYLKPGKLAQFRDVSQWLRYDCKSASRSSRKPSVRSTTLVLRSDEQRVESEGGDRFVVTLPKSRNPVNGLRNQHFALKVMKRVSRSRGRRGVAATNQQILSIQDSDVSMTTENANPEVSFEDLPMEVLVNVLCHLKHSELWAPLCVSKRMHEATQVARLLHFNYMTPDHRTDSRSAFLGRASISSPGPMRFRIPLAPRQPPRPMENQIRCGHRRRIAAPLFLSTPDLQNQRPPDNEKEELMQNGSSFVVGGNKETLVNSHRVLFGSTENTLCKAKNI